jgi:hypothetical protein
LFPENLEITQIANYFRGTEGSDSIAIKFSSVLTLRSKSGSDIQLSYEFPESIITKEGNIYLNTNVPDYPKEVTMRDSEFASNRFRICLCPDGRKFYAGVYRDDQTRTACIGGVAYYHSTDNSADITADYFESDEILWAEIYCGHSESTGIYQDHHNDWMHPYNPTFQLENPELASYFAIGKILAFDRNGDSPRDLELKFSGTTALKLKLDSTG